MNVTYNSSVDLSGTTQFGTPGLNLGGMVLEDVLRPFTAPFRSEAITGTLQDRVVRMGDNTLAFYTRIKEFSGSQGITEVTFNWLATTPPATINLDFRTDGLGIIGPQRVAYENSGQIRWTFNPPITPTALGRFMFMIVPGVTEYARPSPTPPAAGNRVIVRGGDYWATPEAILCFAPVLG